MAKSLFRKKALEQLASPDNIHELIQVTSSKSWLALIGFLGIIVFFLVWSILGELPKTTNGQGILIQSGGIAEVTLLGSGIVNQILVEEGEFIHQNDTIAIVAQPELQLQIENALEKLRYLKNKRIKLVRFNILSEKIQQLYEQKYQLDEKINDHDKQFKQVEEELNKQQELLSQNKINKENLNQTRLKFVRLQRNKLVLENELQKIQAILKLQKIPQSLELENIETEIREQKILIDELNVKFTLSAYIKSPYAGKVIEIMNKKGQLIESGTPVISMEIAQTSESSLEAIIYLPASEGKKITKGMKAHIAPSTVKIEEFGYMEGIVSKVAEYPSSRQGMTRILGNAELVATFSKNESPLAVWIQLKKAPTPSGFLWTTAQGPSLEIHSGTLCEANIIIQTQRPISFLLPFLGE